MGVAKLNWALPTSTRISLLDTSTWNFYTLCCKFKLNSYSNASVFLSLCHMCISLFRMRILVCEVEKWNAHARKRCKKACVIRMNSALVNMLHRGCVIFKLSCSIWKSIFYIFMSIHFRITILTMSLTDLKGQLLKMAATVMTVEFGTSHHYYSLEENSEPCLCSSLNRYKNHLNIL